MLCFSEPKFDGSLHQEDFVGSRIGIHRPLTFSSVSPMNHSMKATILVIDPDALSLTAISAMLHSANYEIHIAQDREAALKAAQQLELDLILCDERIDESQGAEVIKGVRALENCADTPIMYMSTNQMPDVIHRSHDHGAAYHLRKPIDPKGLLEMVDTALWQLPLINDRVRQHSVRQPHFNLPNITMPSTENSSLES